MKPLEERMQDAVNRAKVAEDLEKATVKRQQVKDAVSEKVLPLEKMLREAEQKASYAHGMCDQFLKDFEEKKGARESQNKMLAENKAVLHDVKPVFLQRQ